MPKKIKVFSFILIIFITLSLTGCWDNEELDTVSIVTGVGIDVSDREDKINLSLQIGKINQEKSMPLSAGGSDDSIILDIEERSILAGVNQLERQVSRALFMYHNQVIIFGKDQARKGITPYLETFIRQNDMRMETLVFVSDGNAKDILKNKMEQDKISSFGITKMIDVMQKYEETYSVRVLDLVCMIMNEGTAPVLPILKIEDSETPRLILKGLAIFNDEKLIGELNEIETRGYSWIKGKFKNTFIEVDVEKGFANLNMSNIRYKLKPRIQDGDLIMDLEVLGDVVLSEVEGFNNMAIEETTKILLEGAKEKIREEIEASFSKSKQLKADFLGFGIEYHKKFPKVWKDMKDNWQEIFPEIRLVTNIDLNLIDTGKIRNSLDMKEGKK